MKHTVPQPSDAIKRAIDDLRRDFVENGESPFSHFYCPILHEDTHTELCEGHIVPEALGNRQWVPQRKDIDNFFGSVAEADFISVVEERESDPARILLDKRRNSQLRPRFVVGDTVLEHYLPSNPSTVPSHHSRARLIGDDKKIHLELAFKLTPEQLDELELKSKQGQKLEIVVFKDGLPAAIASAIKAAHLTMFAMFGYQWVFSIAGRDLAQILRRFFLDQRETPKARIEAPLREHFSQHAEMVKPLVGINPDVLRGTINDNRIVAFTDSQGRPFVVGIIVKAGTGTFSVLVPAGDSTVDTYFSFLKCPPESVALHVLEMRDKAWHVISSHRVGFGPNKSNPLARD